MADGNMGDLSFSLTLKSRVEEETRKVIKDLIKVDETGKQAQHALEGISEAVRGIGSGNTKSLNKFIDALDKIEEKKKHFKNDEFLNPSIVKALESAEKRMWRISAIMDEMAQKKQVSLFSNGFDTKVLERRIEALTRMKEIQEKLAYYHPKAQYAFLDYESSLKFGNANSATLRHKEDELQRLRNIISDLEAEFNKLGGNNAFKNADGQIKNFEQTLARLKESGGQLNLGKMLGLENKSTDWFRTAKEAAMATEAHAKRQNELTVAYEKYFRVQEQVEAAENRLAEATARTNQARREAIVTSRQQAEALVRDRIKELEAQRQQLQGLFGSGKNVLNATELSQVQHAFSQITSELNTLRSALNNLGSYSIKELFSFGRGTSDYSPLVSNMRTVLGQKQEAIEKERQLQREIAASAAKARNDLANAFASVNKEAEKTSQVMSDIKSLFLQGGLVYGAKQFFDSIVQTGGEIVQQHVALRSILGDVQKADELFAQTQQLALQSPFKFGELNRDVKQLAAFGVEANDLYDTTKRLADIASGLGVSFERLGLAYGQVKARSWLDGKELRQFAYAGLPLLQKIAELYNATGKNGKTDYKAGDIKKMITKREVSFEDVQKVLWGMTDQGGQFYNMQFVLSETLLGRWNKLIDAWDIMLGKFAEGKSVVGGTFSFLINRATDLVLALDKLSPAVMAFGAMFALRKGTSAIASATGISNLKATLQAQTTAQLRNYAIEQQRLVVEGQITRQQATQNIMKRSYELSDAKSVVTSYERLALEGRLSALQLQKAFRQGLITKELVQQLEIMGLISAKESELIMKEGARARAGLMGRQAMSKFGGFFSGLNLATIGVTAITAIASAWYSFSQKLKQDAETIANNAKSTFDALGATLNEVNNKGTGAVLQEQVDKMTEALKQSNLYTDSIKEQIASTNDLGKEYDILKQKIIDARKENNFAPGEADAYAKAKAATGAGRFGGSSFLGQILGVGQDNIDENTNDVAAALASLQMKLDKFGDSTKFSMEKAADAILGTEAAGKSLEEKLSEIYTKMPVKWANLVTMVAGEDDKLSDSLYDMGDELRAFGNNFEQITTDDIPKYLEEMAKRRGMSLDDFSKWCQQHPEKFRTMLDQMLSEANSKVPNLVQRLQQVAKAILQIGNTEPKKGNDKPKVWKNPLKEGTVDRKAYNKLFNAGKLKGGAGGFYQKEMAELIFSLNNGQSTGWEDFGSHVQKVYKEVRNENDAAKAAGENAPFARKQAMLEAVANQLGITLDIGKNKVTGNYGKDGKGRKEDTALKALQERLSSLKSARQMYQKYQTTMSDEVAKNRTLESFPEVVGLSLDNYQEAVKKLLEGFSINTTERKKFQTSVYREVAEWIFEEKDKKEFEAKAATFSEAMSRLASQWDNYKSLLEKTGNKGFAGNAFTDGYLVNGKAQALMDAYKKNYGRDFDITAALAMTDGQAKATLKGPNEYESWKQIVDLLRNNYITALNDGADAISQTLSLAQKLDAVTQKYNKKRTEAGNNQDLIDRYNYLEKNEKSGILLEDLKSQINWEGVFGNLDNYTKKELKKIRTQLRGLVKGGFLDGMTPEDLKTFYDGAQKLDEAINGGSFGGLTDLIKELTTASQEYDAAVEQYKKDVEAGKDSWQVDISRRAMNAAENRKIQALNNVRSKKGVNFDNVMQLANMFTTLGRGDGSGSTLLQNAGGWAQSISTMAGGEKKNSEKLGSIVGFFAGLTEAISEKGLGGFVSDAFEDIGGAVNSIFKDLFGLNLGFAGADYDDYNDAKAEYENLIDVWDTLISKKKQYMSEHWGTEAANASKEAMALLQSEIKQTKEIAKGILGAGASMGSHSIGYRMWQGSYSYNGTNWRDVAKEISSKYGVQFNGMEDMLNMSPEVLEKIKTDYSGLWAHMDGDFKEYLDKLIEYGDQVDDMTESLVEKLTGNKFSDLVSSWGDAMATMANSSDNLVEHFEENLKKTILNSMIENIYGKKIKALIAKTQSYAENNDKLTNSDGTISEYTGQEYADIMNSTEELSQQIEATRDYLQKTYHWSDDSSSSSTNTVKGITEETADIIVSYLNAIRLDVSVNRENVKLIADAVAGIPEMSTIAQSQLTQLNAIAQNTLRNADAAEEIVSLFKAVTTGTKKVYMY